MVAITEHVCEDVSEYDFRAFNILIANISSERSMPAIITMIWTSHFWKALKACLQTLACDSYNYKANL